jgi:hypothetical protein
MNPNLVGPPRLQPNSQQIRCRPSLQPSNVCDGGSPILDHGHTLAVSGIPGDRTIDRHFFRFEPAPGRRQISPPDLTSGQRSRQPLVRLVAARHHQQATGIAIQSMHDPWSIGQSDTRERSQPLEKSID